MYVNILNKVFTIFLGLVGIYTLINIKVQSELIFYNIAKKENNLYLSVNDHISVAQTEDRSLSKVQNT